MSDVFWAVVLATIALLYAMRRIETELSSLAWQQKERHAELLVQFDRINDNLHTYVSGVEDAVKEVTFAVQDVENNTRPPKSQFPEYD